VKFSDIPIIGYRIEVDEYALGQFVLEKFVERFGPEQILGADTNRYSDSEYGVIIIAKEETEEMGDFAFQLSDELYEKGVSVSIPIRNADEILYGPRIKTKNLYPYDVTAQRE
jgi:hypothetical protein